MTSSGDDANTGSFADLQDSEPFPGIVRHALTTSHLTLNRYSFDAGADFPLHSHAQEQVTVVEEGSIEMTMGDRVVRLGAGEWSVVGPGVEHGIRAGADGARILAIVAPPRTSGDEIELSSEGPARR